MGGWWCWVCWHAIGRLTTGTVVEKEQLCRKPLIVPAGALFILLSALGEKGIVFEAGCVERRACWEMTLVFLPFCKKT